MTEDMARAGLGKAGRASVARSIWKKCVPPDLLDVYLRAFRSGSSFATPNSRSASKLRKMMNSVRLDANGLRITGRPASAPAFLRYKIRTKCCLLLNATKINAADDTRPPRIKLPSLQLLAERLAKPAGKRLWMAKLDLTNAYWSIRLPGAWRRVFVVRVHGRGWRYTRLPFGWKYSPAVCQHLVRALVRSAVQGLPVLTDVYLDDILVSASSPHLVSRALRKIINKLRSVGFIISPKSETTPSQRLTFIGKHIDSRQASIANSPEAIAAALRIWLRGLGRGGGGPPTSSRVCWAACNGWPDQGWVLPPFWQGLTGRSVRVEATSPGRWPGRWVM